MMLGIVAEGMTEEKVVPVVLGWLGVRHRLSISRADGADDLLQRARDLADWQLLKGATHVLFCIDADKFNRGERIAQLQARLAEPRTGRVEEGVFFFVPIREMEAWLLADEAALSKVVGNSVERQTDFEAPGAVERLHAIFHAQGGYSKTRHPRRIAEAARDETWRRATSYEASTAGFR